jgi:DNA polymerase I-like protein with 3'-5' exonuclease and polymerase domains
MVHDEIVLEVKDTFVQKWSTALATAMVEAGRVVCEQAPIVAEASFGATWADAK